MDKQAQQIAEAVVSALDSTRQIDRATHHVHHDYVAMQMLKDKKRIEMYDAIKLHVIKFGALAILSVAFVAAWQYFKFAVNAG